MKFKLWDVDESYFAFAPIIIYDISLKRFSIGFEMFGCRLFYLSIQRRK